MELQGSSRTSKIKRKEKVELSRKQKTDILSKEQVPVALLGDEVSDTKMTVYKNFVQDHERTPKTEERPRAYGTQGLVTKASASTSSPQKSPAHGVGPG